jgi:type VI secretion system secreted protein VgrG
MSIKQDTRHVAIKTALGPDVLALRSVSIQEQLSRLFQIEVELSSEDGEVDLDKVVGHDATIRLDVAKNDERYFHGFVSRMVQVANQGGYARYHATIVPWLWLLTRTSDCRIFQEKTVPDIIEEIFKLYGFSDYKLKLTATYPKWEYCVQYRETAFNFVSRLMEQEGIYYYFEHADGKHTLVLADSISAHNPFPGYAEIIFHELESGAVGREVITDWTVEKELQPVKYALNDFDFKKPKTSLLASSDVSRPYGKADYEIYDFPGEYVEHDEGQRLADARINELQSQYEVLHGEASARGLAAGCVFKLKNHPRDDQNREYLVTTVAIQVDAGEFGSGGEGTEGEFFTCRFSAISKTQQYRPERSTPKPIVQGPQTATVVGPAGEEIHTDKYSRIKVQFPWDRYGKWDENSSCWIRVSQFWAGKQWGSIHIPRIGQEVIVEFLEGDPDEPIITGRVYNADQMPPYALPGDKTQSGVKSRSSKGGSTANFNEIRFEDKKGSEEVYVHAEKDQNNVVENDETTQVGHDRTERVGHDENLTVDHDQTETVGNNRVVKIGMNHTENVGSSMNITVGSTLTETVAVNYAETVGAAMELTVGAALAISVGAAMAETVGGVKTESVGMEKSENIGGNRSLNVGGDKNETIAKNRVVSVTKDQQTTIGGQQQTSVTKESILNAKKVQIVAEDEIQFKTGSATITLKKNGDISVNGKKIEIKGSGDVIIKGSTIKEN